MTLDEFVEECQKKNGWWISKYGVIRNNDKQCPLQAASGRRIGYRAWGEQNGLNTWAIIHAADGDTNGPYRRALMRLVGEPT